MKNTPLLKKQWHAPKLVLIATNDVQSKSQNNYNEKTFISSKALHTPSGTFNQLFFQKAPGGGVVGFATKNSYNS